MILFAVDSSAKAASCALCEDEKILGSFYLDIGRVHSRTLMPMAHELLRQAGLAPADVDLFAAAVGPGSFTGVRIGVAAVKGLAFAADKPCAGVPTLDAMAENLAHLDRAVVCAVMDARRGQVYNAVYDVSGGGIRKRVPDRAVSADTLTDEMKNEKNCVFYIGDGARLCYNMSREKGPGASLAPPQLLNQNAAGVAAAAYKIWLAGGAVGADELNPVYLRLPQAEREIKGN